MTQTLSEIVEQTAAWPENKPMTVKYCEDCRFYRVGMDGDPEYANCLYPRKDRVALARVSRNIPANKRLRYCESERGHDNSDSCGPDAKWFEAKASSSVAA